MGDQVLYPPPLFFRLDDPAFTYLCIISHHCNASESYFKENLGIHDILIHQKSPNLVNSLLLAYARSFGVWDNMASLQWWDLIGQKFLNDWHVGTVNYNYVICLLGIKFLFMLWMHIKEFLTKRHVIAKKNFNIVYYSLLYFKTVLWNFDLLWNYGEKIVTMENITVL